VPLLRIAGSQAEALEEKMDYPWAEFFHLGLVVQAFFPKARERKGPALEITRKLAADPFFHALEISGVEAPALRKELAQIVRSSGKSLVFSGGGYCRAGGHNLHDLEESKRANAIHQVKKIIDEAHDYGCRILYIMGFEAPGPQDCDRARESFARSLAELSSYARGKNPSAPLTLSVENFYRLTDTPFLIGPTLEFAGMLRDLRRRHPNLGLTFDTSHILQLKEDLALTFARVQDVIAHIHLSNCLIKDRSSPFYGDKHPPYGLPGSEIGIPELAGFFRTLKAEGCFSRAFPTGKPVLSLEVITPPGRTPEETLGEAKEAFQKAWAEVEKK
jgi:sugar phosphate isomerase/epimerase